MTDGRQQDVPPAGWPPMWHAPTAGRRC